MSDRPGPPLPARKLGVMTGNASVLGILPPATVRIDMDGWVQDWPFECICLDEHPTVGTVVMVMVNHNRCLTYAYEHAHQQDDGSWLFVGAEDFTVTAGPPQPASVN